MGLGCAIQVRWGCNLVASLLWAIPCRKLGFNGTRGVPYLSGNVVREDSGTFGVVLGCLGSSDLADMDKIAPFRVVQATLTGFQTSKYVENS